jgi:hypothetical protein
VKHLYKLVSAAAGLRHSQQTVDVQQRIAAELKIASPDEVRVPLDEDGVDVLESSGSGSSGGLSGRPMRFDHRKGNVNKSNEGLEGGDGNRQPSQADEGGEEGNYRDDEPLLARRRKVERQRRAKQKNTNEKTRLLGGDIQDEETGCCSSCSVM